VGTLASFVVRRRYAVIALWTVVVLFAVPRAARIGDRLQLNLPAVVPTESARARQVLDTRFDASASTVMAVVAQCEGVAAGATRAFAAALVPVIGGQAYVDTVIDAREALDVPSETGPRMLIVPTAPAWSDRLASAVALLRVSIGAVTARPEWSGCRALVTGEPAIELDMQETAIGDARRLEVAGMIPAAGILLWAFGSIGAALIPLVTGVLAIVLAVAALAEIAALTPVAIFVIPVVSMIGLGAGIDYSLLVTNRFREERRAGADVLDAARQSATRAGRTVLVSGMCVVVGFGALLLAPTTEIRSVGLAGLLVAAAAMLLAVTFVPALLATTGPWLDRPAWLSRRILAMRRPMVWQRWGGVIVRHRWGALLLGLLAVGLLALPVTRLRIGPPREGWFPRGVEVGEAANMLDSSGLRGEILPLELLVVAPDGERVTSAARLRGLMRLSDSLAADPRVARVRGPVTLRRGMSLIGYLGLYGDLDRARARYPELFGTYLSTDASVARIEVILADSSSVMTATHLVRELRADARRGLPGLEGTSVLVGGFPAAQVDEEANLRAGFPGMVAMILGASGLMLLIAFRSLLMPIKAIALNLLSLAGAFGVLVLVFQFGVGGRLFGLAAPAEALFIHVLVMVFAMSFGMSLDYEVFLIARIKEAFDAGRDDATATVEALSTTAGVITSAAAIMVVVFGAFSFSRIPMAQLLAFGLAMAVLIDATIVRLVIVPAFMRIAGRWNWWPGARRVKREG